MREIFYSYVFNISTAAAPLGANVNLQVSFTLDKDSKFEHLWLVATSTGTFRTRYSDGGTGYPFMKGKVNNANLFGTAQLPMPVIPPYIFLPEQGIDFDVDDTSGANNVIQIVFIGKKIYLEQAGHPQRTEFEPAQRVAVRR